jgi:hypothetical protein
MIHILGDVQVIQHLLILNEFQFRKDELGLLLTKKMIRSVFCLVAPNRLCQSSSSISRSVYISKSLVLSSSARNFSEAIQSTPRRRKAIKLSSAVPPASDREKAARKLNLDQPTPEQGKTARLGKMTESWESNDPVSFSKYFSDYSEVIKYGFGGYLPTEERKNLTWMLKPFVEQLEERELAVVLKSLANCGFTASRDDLALITKLKGLYMTKSSSFKEKTMFLSAMSKLKLPWKKEERKSEILRLIEMSSSELTTASDLAQLLSSISGIGVSWKSLTLNCQENIIKKFLTLNDKIDPIDAVKILHSLSSIEGLKIREMTKAVSSTFLLLAKYCLSLNGLENNEQQWTRQVVRLLMIQLLF